ncbi:kinase-like protein, partial [Violaceomyces palustris]
DADEPLDVIGQGTFGLIRKVRRKSDAMLFARKELNFERMSERDRKQIVAEVNILRTLNHENVVKYEERYVDSENGILYIVMEYCEGGDLGSVIKKCRKTNTLLPEDTVWSYLSQMTLALDVCHYRGGSTASSRSSAARAGSSSSDSTQATAANAIIHRDLKPDNVFLDSDQNIKLGDFGLSKQIAAQAFANTYVGTPYYMSPELATGKMYDFKSDIWALGCIVFELCALNPPFDATTQAELTHKIKLGQIPALPRQYSSELGEVVNAMLQLDPKRRPTTKQLLNFSQIK